MGCFVSEQLVMSDWDKLALAFDMLESAEVVQEFPDSLWLKVDAGLWRDFLMLSDPHEPHCPAVDGFGCRCGEV